MTGSPRSHAYARELAFLRASVTTLAARIAALSNDVGMRVEVLESRNRWLEAHLEHLERRVAALERDLGGAPRPRPELVPRVPLARAAVLLGTSRKHALRLAAEGLLEAADVRQPGAPQAAWV